MKQATLKLEEQSPPTVVASPAIAQACSDIRDLGAKIAALESLKKALTSAVKEHMGDARQLLNDKRDRVLATQVFSDCEVFDREGFALDHPRLLKQYTNHEQRVALRVK